MSSLDGILAAAGIEKKELLPGVKPDPGKPGSLMGESARLAKQPVWVRDLVRGLESALRQAYDRIENLQDALARANGELGDGKVIAETAVGQQIHLGDGATVDFELEGGRLTVTPEDEHLVIDGPLGMAVEPVARNSIRVVIR